MEHRGDGAPHAPAEHGKDHVFHQQLSRHSRGAGAQRRTDRDLARACRGASELKAGHVRHSGHEQQSDGGEQHDQRAPHLARESLVQRNHGNANRASFTKDRPDRHLQIRRRGRRERARGRFVGRLQGRRTRTQPRNGLEHRHEVARRRIDAKRYPRERLAIRIRRTIRQDPDDPMRFPFELNRSPHCRDVTAEPLAPEPLRQNDDVTVLRRLVAVAEQRSGERMDAERSEHARGRGDRADARRLSGAGERQRAGRPRADLLDRRRRVAPREVGGIAEGIESRTIAAARFLQEHETVRVGPGQRLQQHAVGDAEQQRRRRDAGGHRADHEHGKRPLATQHTTGIADVLHQTRRPPRRGRRRRLWCRDPARTPLQRGRFARPDSDLPPHVGFGIRLGRTFRASGLICGFGMLRELFDDVDVAVVPGASEGSRDVARPVTHGRSPQRG